MTASDLKKETMKELLCFAKCFGIKGRHKMSKAELVEAISCIPICSIEKPISESKERYIRKIETGLLIAFIYVDNEGKEKMLSGKVINILNDAEIEVQTKNGKTYKIEKKRIAWVKTGSRWPKGVYLALKGKAGVHDES